MPQIKDAAERRVLKYVEGFVKNSKPARLLEEELVWLGVGLFPVVDHITDWINLNRRFQVDPIRKLVHHSGCLFRRRPLIDNLAASIHNINRPCPVFTYYDRSLFMGVIN